jgi:hypothetical protein
MPIVGSGVHPGWGAALPGVDSDWGAREFVARECLRSDLKRNGPSPWAHSSSTSKGHDGLSNPAEVKVEVGVG